MSLNLPAEISLQPATLDFLSSSPKRLLIDGEWVEATKGETFDSYNPATGELLARLALADAEDVSNPYFDYDPAKCVVCYRCVRACEETQGTFALTVEGRGFESRIVASEHESFLESECVSCGACVAACPTGSLIEKSVLEMGAPERTVTTTCAYCGVGCSLNAEMRGDEVVRIRPLRGGVEPWICDRGRYVYDAFRSEQRILAPQMRVDGALGQVSWDEAVDRALALR